MERAPRNTVVHGDCITQMQRLPAGSVDFILTDSPYLVRYRYRDRSGRQVANDDYSHWLQPAFDEMARVLKPSAFMVCFYGWNKVDTFFAAWRGAGFRIIGHMVFCKSYASSRRFLRHTHEQAYLLARGNPPMPAKPMIDVLPWEYIHNTLHPSQKPLQPLEMLVDTFSTPGDLVLDPFCGSGSSLVAAKRTGRDFLDAGRHHTASLRLYTN